MTLRAATIRVRHAAGLAAASARRLSSQIASHYSGDVREVYDSAPFYAPGPYEAWLTSACLERLELRAGHTLADIGGGSGAFASKLKQETGARWLTVIEPSADMLSGASSDMLVDAAECADATTWAEAGAPPAFAAVPTTYDRLLLKEVVHHLDAPERRSLFGALRTRRLRATGGQLLIVTRPHREIDYPLWPAARDVWAAHQPSEAQLETELRAAGFDAVKTHLHAYPHEVATDEWCRLVRGRFWSTFSHFSDDELLAACAHIRAQAAAAGDAHTLHFDDRLLLIVARMT